MRWDRRRSRIAFLRRTFCALEMTGVSTANALVVAEVIDNSEADQAEAILYYLAKHTEVTCPLKTSP